jgi:hypothetical protein
MGDCPPDGFCYTRTLCGSAIRCHDIKCDPATEYNREYWSAECSPGAGANLLVCLPQTTFFSNACGCGCEQDPSCPSHLGCIVLQTEEARPGTGGAQGSGAAPWPGGTGGTSPGAELPVCAPEDLARCPFSDTY